MTWPSFELGDWSITLAPAVGGRVARLAYRGTDILVPLPDAAFPPDHWPKAGAYPLIPFHNRVPNARFTWGDRAARLPVHPDTAPHALHGPASRMRWTVASHAAATVGMTLDSPATEAWPWAYSAEQRFEAEGDRLILSFTMNNRDSVPIPAGLGWHPYFPAGTRIDDNAATGWQVGPEFLPQPPRRPRSALCGDTAYLTDWSEAQIALPAGLTLRMTRDIGLSHLVRFAPEGAAFACLEPVSHPVAAMCDGPTGAMDEIAVGGRLHAQVSLYAL